MRDLTNAVLCEKQAHFIMTQSQRAEGPCVTVRVYHKQAQVCDAEAGLTCCAVTYEAASPPQLNGGPVQQRHGWRRRLGRVQRTFARHSNAELVSVRTARRQLASGRQACNTPALFLYLPQALAATARNLLSPTPAKMVGCSRRDKCILR